MFLRVVFVFVRECSLLFEPEEISVYDCTLTLTPST